jgi:hypothetical protein
MRGEIRDCRSIRRFGRQAIGTLVHNGDAVAPRLWSRGTGINANIPPPMDKSDMIYIY